MIEQLFATQDDTVGFATAIKRDRYQLRVNAYFTIAQPTQPNAWYRFWQRVLLGWTWEPLP